ncbi:MAG: tRNA lysidine(34) synthetase TilS [Firmicutes bacterium]|nr:tRNA lysidine(34) synthetase TilS [Bacillota bacterium]
MLAAVSGGPDSVALLLSLMELRDDLGFSLAACHLDHGFRGEESRRDAEFVASLCSGLGVECVVSHVDVPRLMNEWGAGAEEAGRRARYRFYEETAASTGSQRVALGHTLDDQAETVLMRMIRGSGIEGLAGIPPVRGMYFRPLLNVTRVEIEEYCATRGISPRIDRTNLEPLYFRNQVRLQVIPSLERWNPRLKEVLAGTAEILREDDLYLESAARGASEALAERDAGGVRIDRRGFLELQRSIQRRVLRMAARDAVLGGAATAAPEASCIDAHDPLGFGHVEAVIGMIESGRAGASLDLPGGLVARLDRNALRLTRSPGGTSAGLRSPVPLRVPGVTHLTDLRMSIAAEIIPVAEAGPRVEANDDPLKAYLDYALVEGPLTVRSRADGDFFYPLGLKGGKKVGDFMTSLKVPLAERDSVPIVLSGDQIAWVGGYRIDERFKVTPATTTVLVLTILENASDNRTRTGLPVSL